MVAKSKDRLEGMNQICDYVVKSAPTILKWVRGRKFPARQDGPNCTWRSSKKAIDEWLEKDAKGEV